MRSVPGPKSLRRVMTSLGVLAALFVNLPLLDAHLRAASLLLRASGDHGRLARLYDTPVTVRYLLLRSSHGTFAARLYTPVGDSPHRGIVLAHGVHYLGIDEPRLTAFADNLARSGLVVLVPELAALADYEIQGSSVDEIVASADYLTHAPGVSPGGVGLMGFSFAGGLVLRAVSDPVLQGSVAFVVSVGGHDDLGRVIRFLATDEIVTPEGIVHTHAHDYGLVVFLYAYADRFVTADAVLTFRDALRLLLQEKHTESLRVGGYLTGDARTLYNHIVAHDRPALAPLVLRVLPSLRDLMANASPTGHLSGLRLPVFLLHGAKDDVIPPSESRFVAQELGPAGHVHLLVTPAIRHVAIEGHLTLWQRLQVVHFMAGVLHGG